MKLKSKLKLYFLLTSLIIKLKISKYKIGIFKMLFLKKFAEKEAIAIIANVYLAAVKIEKEKYKSVNYKRRVK
jgi:hypothetical protein